MKSIVLAGGHLSPAISIAEECKKRGYRVVVFGRAYAFSEAKDKPSLEKMMFEEMGVDFRAIEIPRTPRSPILYLPYLVSLIRTAASILQSLREIKPIAVISFGGYVSIPLLIAAVFSRAPIFLHEQTTTAGQSNKMFGLFAHKVFISWPEAAISFPESLRNKIVLTGNPVRKEIRTLADSLPKPKNKKELTIYITGGSTGAHAINRVIGQALEMLLEKYTVIHQVGESHYNDFEILTQKRNNLPKELQKKYHLVRYVSLSDIKKIYADSDILVSRSGANTVTEVALLGKPAIFIPLPLAQYNEQELLARKLNDNGISIIIDQNEFTPESLLGALENVSRNYETYVKHGKTYRKSQEITRHKDAHSLIIDTIESWYNQRGNTPS